MSRVQPRPKQDFNTLFGFKYDPATNEQISGLSSEGKFLNQMTTRMFSFSFIGVDLLDYLLTINPDLRPTADQALSRKLS